MVEANAASQSEAAKSKSRDSQGPAAAGRRSESTEKTVSTASSSLSSTAAAGRDLKQWLRDFHASQEEGLRPWILSDWAGRFRSHRVSIKGARRGNDDSSHADGELFGVYDGHGNQSCGKIASELACKEVARAFWAAMKKRSGDRDRKSGGGLPVPVDALNSAYAAAQVLMPTCEEMSQGGTTGVTCFIEPAAAAPAGSGLGSASAAAGKVYLSVLGKWSEFSIEHEREGVLNFTQLLCRRLAGDDL